MNKRVVWRTLSQIMLIEAALMLLPAVISLYFKDFRTLKVFVFMSVITIGDSSTASIFVCFWG